jgi:hypothetical protein
MPLQAQKILFRLANFFLALMDLTERTPIKKKILARAKNFWHFWKRFWHLFKKRTARQKIANIFAGKFKRTIFTDTIG